MGVLGVALSGVFSRCVACVALWILLDYHTHLRFRALDFVSISLNRIRRILHIGLPAAGEQMCYWTAFMVVTTFVARMGADSLTTQSYALQIQRLAMLFSFSIGLGTEILIGHLVGAGQFEDAYHRLLKSLRTGLTFVSVAMLAIASVAPFLLGFFTQNAVILAGGILLLRMAVVLEPGRVFNVIVISSLRATGDVGFPIKMAVLSMWFVWVPLAWLLGLRLHMGLPGIWIAMTLDEWTRGVLMYRRWKTRKWIKHAERMRANVTAGLEPLTTL
jgi:Na+-driven multidrug efflux pump